MPNDRLGTNLQLLAALDPSAAAIAVKQLKLKNLVSDDRIAVINTQNCCPTGGKKNPRGSTTPGNIPWRMDTCHGLLSSNASVIVDDALQNFQTSLPLIDLRTPERIVANVAQVVTPPVENLTLSVLDGLFFMFPSVAGVFTPSLIEVRVQGWTEASGGAAAAMDYDNTYQVFIDDATQMSYFAVAFRDRFANHQKLRWNNASPVTAAVSWLPRAITVTVTGYPAANANVILAPLNSNYAFSLPILKQFEVFYGQSS